MRCILAVAVLHSALAVAGEAPAVSADADFRAALARAPAIAAARARVAAAERAEAYAGVLPDPMLGADLGRERPRMGEDMTMYGAMIEQPLPRWGEREAMRLNARAQSSSSAADLAAVVGEHAAAVASALAEQAGARDRLALAQQTRTRVAALQEAVRPRLASGAGMVGDQFALETRLQRLAVEIADLGRRQADAEAEVRGRLGLAPEAGLPSFAAPDPAAIRAESNPMARAATAMRMEAQAMEREAESRGNPESALGVGWERESAGTMEQSDKFILSFRLSLPVHRAAYRAAAEAARSRARAAGHEVHGAAWMARAQIERAQRAVAQAGRAAAAAEAVAARARSEFDALVAQVGTGMAGVGAALAILDMVAEAQGEAIMARQDGAMALAELWRLAPPDLPEATGDDPHHPQGTP